jgi:hypothetical protein
MVRGRIFRRKPRKTARQVSPERRRVCVLDRHHGRLLEHWGEGQPCFGPKCSHKHQTRIEVDKLVREGVLRYVPGSRGNVAAFTYGRIWKGVPSGWPTGPKVMQLIT